MNNSCITGLSPTGHCGAAAYCGSGHTCCAGCNKDCNVRCGWLQEAKERELTTGWLSPTGEFFETELYGHIDKAAEIAKSYFPYYSEKPNTYAWDKEMQSAGWVEIHLNVFLGHEWLFGFERHLTPEQRRFLEPYTHDAIPLNSYSMYRYEQEVENG